MKTFKNIVLTTLLFFLPLAVLAQSKNYTINSKVESPSIIFLSTAPLEDIKGNVQPDKISGSFTFDPNNVAASSGKVTLLVKAMETGIQLRDEHLHSDVWLDAEKYPNITFDLKKINNPKISAKDDKKGRTNYSASAEGIIKIHGKSKNIKVPINLIYIKESEETRKRASGDFISVDGKFDVALADFGVKGKEGIVGSKVGKVINIEFKLFFNSK